MVCEEILISGHGFQKIFERYIKIEDIEIAISKGEIIKEYIDEPYPSFLLLGFINGEPLHVVVARNGNTCILIIAYFPDATMWDATFKNKTS